MRATAWGAESGSSSTKMRPLVVSITITFWGSGVRQSASVGEARAAAGAGAAAGRAAIAGAGPARRASSRPGTSNLMRRGLPRGAAPRKRGGSARHLFEQAALDPFGDERRDVAAEGDDLLDQPRGDGLVAGIGHQKHRLGVAVELLVHRRHLEFELEVGHGPQAAQDHRGADVAGGGERQPGVGMDEDLAAVLQLRGLRLEDLDAFLEREHRPLATVDGDPDHQAVHQPQRPPDQVQVPVVDGIEGARIEAGSRHFAVSPQLSPGSAGPSASPPLASPSIRSTETTCSSSAVRKIVTPWVFRPTMRIWPTGTRISWPWSVTSRISSASSTGKAATSRPPRLERSWAIRPWPPLPVRRKS